MDLAHLIVLVADRDVILPAGGGNQPGTGLQAQVVKRLRI